VRKNQRLFAALSTLEYLQRSGRVGWAAANIGALLQIKPILEVEDGEAKAAQRVRTFSRAMQQLAIYAREDAPLDRLALLHTNNLEGVEELREQIKDILPENTLTINITPVVGAHIGPGGLGIVTVRKSWKE
jgi:DegV family protein with EDD domain